MMDINAIATSTLQDFCLVDARLYPLLRKEMHESAFIGVLGNAMARSSTVMILRQRSVSHLTVQKVLALKEEVTVLVTSSLEHCLKT